MSGQIKLVQAEWRSDTSSIFTFIMNILVVEDEPKLASLVQRTLQSEGYQCEVAHDGEAGLEATHNHQPDLVVLDIGLPKLNGLEVCTRIRQSKVLKKDPYIMMLTGRSEEVDRIIGLHTGADDYMVKPFSSRELSARVFALLRRSQRGVVQSSVLLPDVDPVVTTKHFRIEPESRQVLMCKTDDSPLEPVQLTGLEFRLLYVLASRPGRVWSRDQLLTATRGEDYNGDDRTIDGLVRRVRPKISPPNQLYRYIKTHTSFGYSFEDA